VGRNYTFFTFGDGEQKAAAALHRAVKSYLAAAGDFSGEQGAVHLSLAYPSGWRWEAAAALLGCALFAALAW
jgi:hypothetical protein